jgi:hypothetical protein
MAATTATAPLAATASSFSIFPILRIRRKSADSNRPRNIQVWASPLTPFIAETWNAVFAVSNGETTNSDCNQIYLPNWVIDIRDEEHAVPTPEVPYRDFCLKRGRLGAHNPPHLRAPGKPRQEFIAYS